MFQFQNDSGCLRSLGRGDSSTHCLSRKPYIICLPYLHDDDEDGLEEQVDSVPLREPEEDPEDARDHEYGAHVDGEGAE